MSKSLEARVARLEEQAGRRGHDLIVILTSFLPAINGKPAACGDLYGYRFKSGVEQPIDTIRKPGESDDAVLERARQSAGLTGSVIVLHELRL